MERIQTQRVIKDLEKKMVILVGPRQAGKTWLAQRVGESFQKTIYLNFDSQDDRRIIQEHAWPPTTELLILDELHKMPQWKNYLKGLYDTRPSSMRLLVTGSARLNTYSHIGDSLAGRYFKHRLLPLSPAELHQLKLNSDLEHLMSASGFPEPWLEKEAVEVLRWRMQYVNSLLTVDILEFDKIQNINAIRTVFECLRRRVGSPISYTSIAEDVAISPNTVKKYIEILEALYIVFRVIPYSKNIARSLLKEPKIYFFDSGLVESNGPRFENLVAVSLLKSLYAREDYLAEECQLHYLRTKDKEEVDFAVCHQHAIETIIEVKTTDSVVSKSLLMFSDKYQLPAIQLDKDIRQDRVNKGIPILSAKSYLEQLYL